MSRHQGRAIAAAHGAGLRGLLERHPVVTGGHPCRVRFDDEARQRLRAVQLKSEPRLAPAERSPTVQAFLSKLPGTLAGVAGLFALADGHESVEPRHVERACEFAGFLEAHFLGTLEGLALDEGARRARNLGRWASRPDTVFSERDVQRANAAGLSRIEHVHAVIEELERRGYVRKVGFDDRAADGRGRKPGTRYAFRPGAAC